MNSGLQVYNEQNKLAQWAQVVAQCRDSGMSVRQWCQENGINISSYYKWQRKECEARSLTPQQYRWLMEGLSVDQPKAHKPVSGLEIV